MNTQDEPLTVMQAYLAMYDYLQLHFERFGPGEVGTILSELSFLEDDRTTDPAAWHDWLKSVEKAKGDKVDASFQWAKERT